MPRADGRISAKTAAERLGVSPALVQIWTQHGVLSCDQRCTGSKLWIRLTDDDIARLDGSADVSDLPSLTELMNETGLPRDTLWSQVRRGLYTAFRTSRGRGQWEWRLLRQPIPVRSNRHQEQHYE